MCDAGTSETFSVLNATFKESTITHTTLRNFIIIISEEPDIWALGKRALSVAKVVHVLNYLSTTPLSVWRSGSISSTLDLGTRQWVMSFMPLPLYPRVGPRDGLDAAENRFFFGLAGNRTPAVQSVARRYTDWAIAIHRIHSSAKNSAIFTSLNLGR
jgi:hypothetical protein